MSALWHPFAEMGAVPGSEVRIVRGDGCLVWDDAGNEYLDGTAALWFNNVGYGRRRIIDAVADQMAALPAFHIFGDFSNAPADRLADRIAGLAPVPGSKVFLGSGGSDAVDSAAKLVRRYFELIGQPDRRVLIYRTWAYHGMHVAGTSLAGMDANRDGYGALVEDVVSVPFDSVSAVADTIERVGAHRIAGMFSEPVIGAGGVRPVPESDLKEVRRLVGEAGALYVADEVITGFGRSGDWFASNRFSLEPDIITFAKGVTSGYQPLGGILVGPDVAAPFWADDSPMWRHGYTYSGHPAACAAALANLEILDEESLPRRALVMESELVESLAPTLDGGIATEVRGGVGMMAAVQIDPDLVASRPTIAAEVTAESRRRGVITRAIAGGGLQVSPPLIATTEDLDRIASTLTESIRAVV